MADTIMGLLNPMIAAIFAAIFAGLWMRDKTRRNVLVLALGHLLLASGFLIFHFSPDPNAAVWAIFMHVIYCISASCVCWAAADRVGQRVNLSAFAMIGVIAAAIMVAGSYGSDMNARLIAANTAYGLIFALTAQVLGRSTDRSPFDQAAFWLIVVTAAQFFVRPQVAALISGPMSAADYRASDFYAVWMLIMGVVSLMLSLSLVAGTVFDQWRTVREEAEIDPLSGLKLRRSFEGGAIQTLEANSRRDVPICMIVADIDHFKRVNDIWGHQAGDQAIAAFGALIGGTVRGTDLCGRIGGEEFCILVYDCELPAAKGLAERIRRKFATLEHEALGPDIRITASFGVADWRNGEGYGKLFARADAALYRAKESGRDRVESTEDRRQNEALREQQAELFEPRRASVQG